MFVNLKSMLVNNGIIGTAAILIVIGLLYAFIAILVCGIIAFGLCSLFWTLLLGKKLSEPTELELQMEEIRKMECERVQKI